MPARMRADAVFKQAIEKIGCCGVFGQETFSSDVLKTFWTIYGHFNPSEPTPIPVLVIHFSPPQNDLIRRAPILSLASASLVSGMASSGHTAAVTA